MLHGIKGDHIEEDLFGAEKSLEEPNGIAKSEDEEMVSQKSEVIDDLF